MSYWYILYISLLHNHFKIFLLVILYYHTHLLSLPPPSKSPQPHTKKKKEISELHFLSNLGKKKKKLQFILTAFFPTSFGFSLGFLNHRFFYVVVDYWQLFHFSSSVCPSSRLSPRRWAVFSRGFIKILYF